MQTVPATRLAPGPLGHTVADAPSSGDGLSEFLGAYLGRALSKDDVVASSREAGLQQVFVTMTLGHLDGKPGAGESFEGGPAYSAQEARQLTSALVMRRFGQLFSRQLAGAGGGGRSGTRPGGGTAVGRPAEDARSKLNQAVQKFLRRPITDQDLAIECTGQGMQFVASIALSFPGGNGECFQGGATANKRETMQLASALALQRVQELIEGSGGSAVASCAGVMALLAGEPLLEDVRSKLNHAVMSYLKRPICKGDVLMGCVEQDAEFFATVTFAGFDGKVGSGERFQGDGARTKKRAESLASLPALKRMQELLNIGQLTLGPSHLLGAAGESASDGLPQHMLEIQNPKGRLHELLQKKLRRSPTEAELAFRTMAAECPGHRVELSLMCPDVGRIVVLSGLFAKRKEAEQDASRGAHWQVMGAVGGEPKVAGGIGQESA